MKTLVLVTGPPGAGKTSLAVPLARELGLPLITKDTIKEALFDSLGIGDLEWSRRLGAATYAVMQAIAAFTPEAVLESNFGPQSRDWLRDLCPDPIEVYCRCAPEEMARRFSRRERHPGHLPRTTSGEEIRRWDHGPLALGSSVLEVDTTRAVDVTKVALWILGRPGFRRSPARGQDEAKDDEDGRTRESDPQRHAYGPRNVPDIAR